MSHQRDGGWLLQTPRSDGDTAAYGEAPGGVVRSAFLRDPDGNVVQLDQRT